MEMQWVDTTDQQRLCVKTYGQPTRPALVLVHGYPDHQAVWEPVIAYLSQDYFVVSYDVRGAGESSIPQKISDYRLARLSQDLEEVVSKVLLNRGFHLAAHDWGSIQSWESVTDLRFKGRILSYSTLSGPCLDHACFLDARAVQSRQSKIFKANEQVLVYRGISVAFTSPLGLEFF